MNTRAIERYKVAHSKLPRAERQVKRQEIEAKYDAKIKGILTAEQSRKMAANKAYREQKKAAKIVTNGQTTQNK